MYRIGLVALLLTAAPALAQAGDPSEDHQAVQQAVLDYVLALYEVDPSRIERSVSPDLAKFGYARSDSSETYRNIPMTYDQFHTLAAYWNVDGRKADAETAPRRVTVHAVGNRTAAASLESVWGVDHMQLAKGEDGRWRIVHVLWEGP